MSYIGRILVRVVLALTIGLVSGFAISEISYLILKEDSRAPELVDLIIPEGTSVDHQLGPLWIPPGSTASMVLDREQNFIFACSFQPSNYFGLDVREPVTIWTRLGGVMFSGIPLGAILALYSFIMWPISRHDEDSNANKKDL